jgi:hypothetical protein
MKIKANNGIVNTSPNLCCVLKGTVQRKLTGVESDIKRKGIPFALNR